MVCAHVEPEGDTACGALALSMLLNRLGKKSVVICQDNMPRQLNFLKMKWNKPESFRGWKSIDTIVTVDAPSRSRIGRVFNYVPEDARVINIDHHISNEFFGDINYVDVKSAACGEVIYDIFKFFGKKPTRREAELMYVAVITDTGSFKYSNTSQRTHQIARDLMGCGVDVGKLSDSFYSSYTTRQLQLYGKLLSSMQVNKQKKVAWVQVAQNVFKQTQTTRDDLVGFVDFLKYLSDVNMVYLVAEVKPSLCKVSFRAKGSVNVSKIASVFGGGGHAKAAGCSFNGKPEAFVKHVNGIL